MGKRQETLAEHVAREHSRPLLSFLARRLRSDEDAKDLLQEVLTALIGVRRRTVKSPLAYAVKCAVAALAAHYQSRKLHLVSVDEAGVDLLEGEDTIGAFEAGADFANVLKQLPANAQRTVYLRRLLKGESFADIASDMKISIPTAHNYYYNNREFKPNER
jgi:RNA polymerase sigma factor (sigma-70 family)